jgi:hypothetical protein
VKPAAESGGPFSESATSPLEAPGALAWVFTVSVAGPNSPAEGQRPTREGLEAAIRASWSLETCDPTDVSVWTPSNPSRGQCAVTALVIHDVIGGELLEAEVHNQDGSRQGFQYWNRLAGVDLDLTRDQFSSQEIVQDPHVIARLPEAPWRSHEQYLQLRDRVHAELQRRH